MRNLVLALSLLVATTTNVSAQKIGHINAREFLSKMADVVKADTAIAIQQRDAVAAFQVKNKAFREKYTAYATRKQEGAVSEVEGKKVETELRKEQQELEEFGQRTEVEIANLRKALYAPILNRLSDAIKSIGKEGAYDYIMDSGAGVFLFTADSQDVTEAVRKKMGM
jgi:Skp family chaperone for outer membrane proteins